MGSASLSPLVRKVVGARDDEFFEGPCKTLLNG